MALGDDLRSNVGSIFHADWKERESTTVPSSEQITLGNDAVKIDATVLYADLADSTKLVEGHKPWFAAEVYKAYLSCASKVIVAETGEITAFDGDRVMGVFVGNARNTNAARAALKINFAVTEIINKQIASRYKSTIYRVRHVVGIDTSSLFVAKTGIRGSNDLVWVGRSANYAAKLSAINNPPYTTFITKSVYDGLDDTTRFGGASRESMWETYSWPAFDASPIYRTKWTWSI